ncbi:MAG: DUF111 family protein [Methanobacterium sp.]|nr:MAG: DUF111 family protein [Methanobacterium sp.]
MLLMTTIDDLPPESLSHVINRTLEKGAKNIHILNAITKKGRMEHIVLVDTDENYLDDICSLLALEFGTLGIKTFKYEHVKFPFETSSKKVMLQADGVHLEMEIRVKFVKKGEEIISLKAEYDDLESMIVELNSRGIDIPFSKLKTLVEAEAYKNVLEDKKISIKVN